MTDLGLLLATLALGAGAGYILLTAAVRDMGQGWHKPVFGGALFGYLISGICLLTYWSYHYSEAINDQAAIFLAVAAPLAGIYVYWSMMAYPRPWLNRINIALIGGGVMALGYTCANVLTPNDVSVEPVSCVLSAGVAAFSIYGAQHIGLLVRESETLLWHRLVPAAVLGQAAVTLTRAAQTNVFETSAAPRLAAPSVAEEAILMLMSVVLVALAWALARTQAMSRRAARQTSLNRAAELVHDMTNSSDPRQAVADAARDLVPARAAYLLEPQDGRLVLTAVSPRVYWGADMDIEVEDRKSPGAHVYRTGTRFLVNEPCWDNHPTLQGYGWDGAVMYEPVQRAGQTVAVLGLVLSDRPVLDDDLTSVSRLLAAEAAGALERADLLDRLQQVTREDALRTVARNLHDSVAQDLATVSMHQEMASIAYKSGSPEAGSMLDRAVNGMRSTRDAMSSLLGSLRRAEGLNPNISIREAFTAVLLDFSHQAPGVDLKVTQNAPDDHRASPDVSEAFYYIMREALHNIIKHAQATTVTVSLDTLHNDCSTTDSKDCLRLTVTDDGIGFCAKVSGGEGFGLLGMAERSEALGGKLRIDAVPGTGTIIELELPLEHVTQTPVPDAVAQSN